MALNPTPKPLIHLPKYDLMVIFLEIGVVSSPSHNLSGNGESEHLCDELGLGREPPSDERLKVEIKLVKPNESRYDL